MQNINLLKDLQDSQEETKAADYPLGFPALVGKVSPCLTINMTPLAWLPAEKDVEGQGAYQEPWLQAKGQRSHRLLFPGS